MAPILRELQARSDRIESVICVTAQHREMLDQVLGLFDIKPDIDLNLMKENQTLGRLTSRGIKDLSGVLRRMKPDLVLVQGDTTTAMVAGLAAFYQRIPVGHVEAGLRTENRYSPFPEEINRRLLGVLGSYHFAPTERAQRALRSEGIAEESIFLTGNTVVDVLRWIQSRPLSWKTQELLDRLGLGSEGNSGCKIILVTAHRRENFGISLENICDALRLLAERNGDIGIVYPVHMNPNVRNLVFERLSTVPRIHLVEPLKYETLIGLLERAYFVLTDSGGLQEEGPSLGKPVLVLREETERPEGVEAGVAKLVGTSRERIVSEVEGLLRDAGAYRQMARAVNPYGDGHAAERIVRIIDEQLNG